MSRPLHNYFCRTRTEARAIAEYGCWAPGKLNVLKEHQNNGLEIVLTIRGRAVWQIEGRWESATTGEIFTSLPWEPHGALDEIETGCECLFAVLRLDKPYRKPSTSCRFHPAFGLDRKFEKRFWERLLSRRKHVVTSTPALHVLLALLIQELESNRDDMPLQAQTLGRALIIELDRCLEKSSVPPLPRDLSPTATRIRTFISGLEWDYAKPWTLASMAEACGIRRTRFAGIFQQLTGDSPIVYLNRVRIRAAQRHLRDTHLSVTRIAQNTGFGTSQYFARVFRDYSGKTPIEYRKNSIHPLKEIR